MNIKEKLKKIRKEIEKQEIEYGAIELIFESIEAEYHEKLHDIQLLKIKEQELEYDYINNDNE